MKLSRLYTNKPSLFTPINFREGFNVILARIRHPQDPEKHSHCLGKSLLIDIIEFCLLRQLRKNQFLKTQAERFIDFVFYLEISTHNNQYVTVRRSVDEPTKIAFKRHNMPYQNFVTLTDSEWDHTRVTFDKALVMMDNFLGLTAIKPWSYRKGVTYFLRSQQDYQDIFQLTKYGHGKHQEWKPYIAHILGLNSEILIQKYDADADILKISSKQEELQSEVTIRPNDFEKLKASIAVKRDEIGSKMSALDRFDFHSQEIALARDTADRVETEIAEINTQLFNARHDLSQIERGLLDEINFDLSDVKRIFTEASLTFPDQLAHDYNELVDFNRRILTERHTNLKKRAAELKMNIARYETLNQELSERRRTVLSILGGTTSLKKFKELQGELDHDRACLALMEEKSAKLGAIIALNEDLRATKARRDYLTGEIEKMIRDARDHIARYQDISLKFSSIVKEILHRTAILYAEQNGDGNIDFNAEFTDADSEAHTEEHRGYTFKQVLCIAFDLAVLISYSKDRFFHFVYHDGGLEQKQSKMKLALLQIIRTTCQKHNIQYILSSIDEDLSNIEETGVLYIQDEEIVLELHDGGNEGRLFKMERF